MIGIIDYGCGNLFSVKNALDFLGLPSIITRDPAEIEKADRLILPGVGAFPHAMAQLNQSGFTGLLKENKKPLLGICLGMQMLFEVGFEFEETRGLGLLSGSIEPLPPDMGLKIPHMGWNELVLSKPSPLLAGVENGDCVYFVHSFYAKTSEACAYSDYGLQVPALVEKGTVFGAQFHPEKSGDVGLRILKNFGGLRL